MSSLFFSVIENEKDNFKNFKIGLESKKLKILREGSRSSSFFIIFELKVSEPELKTVVPPTRFNNVFRFA